MNTTAGNTVEQNLKLVTLHELHVRSGTYPVCFFLIIFMALLLKNLVLDFIFYILRDISYN